MLGGERELARELIGGGSYQSASAPEIHLGLGSRGQGTIRIRWQSGAIDIHPDLPAGTWIVVEGRAATRLR